MTSTYRFYLVAVLMFVFSGCDNKPGGQFTNPDTRLITMSLDLVAQGEYQQALPYLKDYVNQIFFIVFFIVVAAIFFIPCVHICYTFCWDFYWYIVFLRHHTT